MSLAEVRERMQAAAARAGRSVDEITLVAVGKTQPVAAIEAAYFQGQRDFGENRAQELVEKLPGLPTDIRWHFVGPLQRNKVRLVRPSVVLLHSMDRLSLAAAWLKGPGRAPPALLQVNIGREPQKSGVLPEEAADALAAITGLGVEIVGLMAIPPHHPDPEQVRPYFRQMVELRARLRSPAVELPVLSMGMSEDFEVAIEEGSTMIRLGRAIFGPRIPHG